VYSILYCELLWSCVCKFV